jgi:hypothetical protein
MAPSHTPSAIATRHYLPSAVGRSWPGQLKPIALPAIKLSCQGEERDDGREHQEHQEHQEQPFWQGARLNEA